MRPDGFLIFVRLPTACCIAAAATSRTWLTGMSGYANPWADSDGRVHFCGVDSQGRRSGRRKVPRLASGAMPFDSPN